MKKVKAWVVLNRGGKNIIFNSSYYDERLPIFTTKKRAEKEKLNLDAADYKKNNPTKFERKVLACEITYNPTTT
jgi:hypothetical protein